MRGLVVTQAQVDAINAQLPKCTRVDAIADAGGVLYIGADLLTDVGAKGTYSRAAITLASLPQRDFTPKPPKGTRT
jgi:hypothetical protein